MSHPPRELLLIAISLTALALGGCGGGGAQQDSSTSPETTAKTRASASAESPATAGRSQRGSSSRGHGEQGGVHRPSAPKPKHIAVTMPPISSAPVAGSTKPAPGVKTVKGGDNSVQEYGTEQGQEDREAVALALQGYLDARAEEDWASACSYLAAKPREELEKLISQAQSQGQQIDGCAGAMRALRASPSQLREQAQIDEVLSLRGGGDVPGDPSYLIFLAPPAKTLYSMPMYLEGGQWKVGLAQASELPV